MPRKAPVLNSPTPSPKASKHRRGGLPHRRQREDDPALREHRPDPRGGPHLRRLPHLHRQRPAPHPLHQARAHAGFLDEGDREPARPVGRPRARERRRQEARARSMRTRSGKGSRRCRRCSERCRNWPAGATATRDRSARSSTTFPAPTPKETKHDGPPVNHPVTRVLSVRRTFGGRDIGIAQTSSKPEAEFGLEPYRKTIALLEAWEAYLDCSCSTPRAASRCSRLITPRRLVASRGAGSSGTA